MSVSNEHLSFPCVDSGVWRPKMRQKKLPLTLSLSLSLSLSHSWKKNATNHVRISICTKYITTKKKKKNPLKKQNGFYKNKKNKNHI